MNLVEIGFWTSNFWVAVGTIGLFFATLVLAYVGWYQIGHLRKESKKWRTLDACEIYDRDPVIQECLKVLRKYKVNKDKGLLHTDDIKIEALSVLNYLDGIAIGVNQGLYLESIVKDHLGSIINGHVDAHVLSRDAISVFEVEKEEFKNLISLSERWKREALQEKPVTPETSYRE
ncbi:DUF4760 domain-containing protein [Agrobacterium deltaense]|uniref:DUF4760 domain-containing protein n=1 Tax=Agrobacterium pusense TaxID=648995 RepID=UPI0035F02EC6